MTKLIAVNEDVYGKLRHLKGNQSFSVLINKLIEKKSGNISKYFGIWRDRNDLDKIEKEITENRKLFWARRRKSLVGA